MTAAAEPRIPSRHVAVIGAGTLGRRIALMFATRGGEVRIFDSSLEAGEAAVAYVGSELPAVIASISDGAAGTATSVDDLPAAVRGAWLVVEAVPERLDLKIAVFAELERVADADAILATNSSSYASALVLSEGAHPERVVNMHFFMPPAHRAIELMSSGSTDPEVIERLLRILPEYGLQPFLARRQSTGFIFNRVWAAIKREALQVVAEGISTPEDVDAIWSVNTGLTVGPFRAMDQVGLDVVLDIENHYASENPALPSSPRELLSSLVEAGRLGVKTGHGFYDYS